MHRTYNVPRTIIPPVLRGLKFFTRKHADLSRLFLAANARSTSNKLVTGSGDEMLASGTEFRTLFAAFAFAGSWRIPNHTGRILYILMTRSGSEHHGPQSYAARAAVQGRIARLAGGACAARLGSAAVCQRYYGSALRVPARLAAPGLRSWMGRTVLAQRIWRTRGHADGTSHLHRGDGPRRGAATAGYFGPLAGRSHAHRLRQRGAEAAPSRENSERRGDLVPGILRTRCRIGFGRVAHYSHARRWILRGQRPEGLDQLRLGRRLVRTGGAH